MASHKDFVRKAGYKVLAWALATLVKYRQDNTAAMIIVALCLVRRDSADVNSGIVSVLTNSKLHRSLTSELMRMIYHVTHKYFHEYHDRIASTLGACDWYNKHYMLTMFHLPSPNRMQPMLRRDDGMWHFYAAHEPQEARSSGMLVCDSGGANGDRCLREFRIRRHHDGTEGVEIYSRQLANYPSTLKGPHLGNGYYKYCVPSDTVLSHRFGKEFGGRTLGEVLKKDLWYDMRFRPADAPDLGVGTASEAAIS